MAVTASFASVGLHLNPSKCELYIPEADSLGSAADTVTRITGILPELQQIESRDLTLLGAPLLEAGIGPALEQAGERVGRMCERIKSLDPHTGLFFLGKHTSAPRLNYLLRCTPSFLQPSYLQRVDSMVRGTAQDLLNVDLSDSRTWQQAILPVRLGGIGLRSIESLSLPCYMASYASTKLLAERITDRLSTRPPGTYYAEAAARFAGSLNAELPAGEAACSQRTLHELICESSMKSLLDSADQRNRARLLAASSPYSGAWLNAVPCSKLGLLLDAETTRISVCLRLGAPVCESHRCRCGSLVDTLGHHGLSCLYSAGRLPRHAELNDVVKRSLSSAGMPSWLEPVGLDRGDGRRPDGITVFPFSHGKCLVWDSTCSDTFAETSLLQSAVSPGSAADQAEQRKRARYATLAEQYHFEPVAVETTGVWGRSSLEFLRRLGSRMRQRTGERREFEWLMQRLSIAVARGNAASIVATGSRL